MARKRRTTKTAVKRSNRKKSDSDQNSNGMVSDENEVDTLKNSDSNTDDNNKQNSNVSGNRYAYYLGERSTATYKPKFRYFERRHSSSQEEDAEINTADLMPQQIQDMILGDVKDVIISQDDIANDTCLQGNVEHEEIIEETIECEIVECVGDIESSEYDERTLLVVEPESLDSPKPALNDHSDLIQSFEQNVQIIEISDVQMDSSEDNTSAKIIICEEDKLSSNDSIIDNVSNDEYVDKLELVPSNDKDDIEKVDEERKKNQSEEPRRRSNRIRVNRWTDNEPKTPGAQELLATPLPPPSSLFESDKPVKVKSRWRRTSELEMGNSTSSLFASDNEQINLKTLSVVLPRIDPEIEDRLRSFQLISQCEFLTPRVKSKDKNMYCDCTLSKEEVSRREMGCGEDCLNRLLMIECGPKCSLGNLCSNKRFQNCQYAPCEVFRTENKGLGLITKENIVGGSFLMEYVGEVLGHKEFRRRAKEYAKEKNAHYYFMSLKGQVIDATMKGNNSRFINHSCDPNSETQKWTVNGEVRIGFFSKRAIAAGEEITFDYKLERYGKEAQKCFCESPKCRGWIGENPENEKEKEKKESGSRRDRKEKKRRDDKKREFLSDRELEDEIEKLVSTGIKNHKHTLTLSRLMVRAEEESSRKQLLEIAQAADRRCLRLFLDYHGLRLLWSWMINSHSFLDLRLTILNFLEKLPITNKTGLVDSKVLSVVQKWANVRPESSDSKERNIEAEIDDSSPGDSNEKSDSIENIVNAKDEETKKNIASKANELLNIWSDLKHEYRIPKKERIEQMKEHEREADRGQADPRENLSYDRHWNYEKDNRNFEKENRYSSNSNSRDRKRGRESPSESAGVSDWRKSRVPDDRNNSTNRLSKTERRQLFAMKVEEEERQKRKMEDWAKQHSQQMLGLPGPSSSSSQIDPNQGYYQQPPYPPADGGEMVFGGCPPNFPPPYMGPHPQPPPPYMEGPPPHYSNTLPPNGPPPGGFNPPPPFSHQPIAPPYQPPLPAYPPFPFNPPPQVYTSNPPLPVPNVPVPPNLPVSAVSLSHPPPIVNTAPPNALPLVSTLPPAVTTLTTALPNVVSLTATPPLPSHLPAHVFPIKLPPKWRSANDKEGRIYYYHIKTRKPQWQIPTEDTIQSDSDSDSEESTEDEDSSTDEEEEEEKVEEEVEYPQYEEEEPPPTKREDDDEEYVPEELRFEDIPISYLPNTTPPPLKRRREGLVQVNIISPRDGEDDYRCGIKKKQIRETKERLAKEKKKHRNSGGAAKCDADTTVGPRRRIKDLFRVQMANVVVALLNPYRKSDCKIARITNTEDFKHLARKLTHFVMVKELKHCASVEGLECNDNVKHKAKDFIRKYMSKFGPVYKRSPEDF